MLDVMYALEYIVFIIFICPMILILADDILTKLCGKGIADIVFFWRK